MNLRLQPCAYEEQKCFLSVYEHQSNNNVKKTA